MVLTNEGAGPEPAGRADAVLELRQVSKSFPGVRAVIGVDLSVRRGETVGIVGENGAGKSTLMKIVAGVYPADSFDGEMLIDGIPRRFADVRHAEAAGVVLVPQELYIAPGLSIAENMFMGRLPGRYGFCRQPPAARAGNRAAAILRHRGQSRFAGRPLESVGAASRHDRLGADQGGEAHHPGRTYRRAHRVGSRGSSTRISSASAQRVSGPSTSPTAWMRSSISPTASS